MTRIGPRPLAAAAALVFLLGLVGLATVHDGSGSTVLTAAAEATTAQKTARISLAMSFGTEAGAATVTGEGTVDLIADRARMTLASPLFPGSMEVVVDGTTAYIRANQPQVQALSAGKAWVAVASSGYVPTGSSPVSGGADPLQSLRLLREKGIVGDVRENGSQDVRGAPTTRHVAEVDLAALFEEADSPQARSMASLLRDADNELEIWVDEADVVRRSVLRTTFRVGGQSVTSTVTTELFDFGVATDGLEPPPADQVRHLGK